MKKIFVPISVFLFVLFFAYTYFNNRCVAFGYNNIAFSTELLCAKTTISETYQYETTIYTPLRELVGEAKEYKPALTPVPTLNTNSL